MRKYKLLATTFIILGLLIVIGLSIWVGFPAPKGFNRLAICYVGYVIGVGLIITGVAIIANECIN